MLLSTRIIVCKTEYRRQNNTFIPIYFVYSDPNYESSERSLPSSLSSPTSHTFVLSVFLRPVTGFFPSAVLALSLCLLSYFLNSLILLEYPCP